MLAAKQAVELGWVTPPEMPVAEARRIVNQKPPRPLAQNRHPMPRARAGREGVEDAHIATGWKEPPHADKRLVVVDYVRELAHRISRQTQSRLTVRQERCGVPKRQIAVVAVGEDPCRGARQGVLPGLIHIQSTCWGSRAKGQRLSTAPMQNLQGPAGEVTAIR